MAKGERLFVKFTCESRNNSGIEFPPHMGVFLGKLSERKPRLSLPHTRGGVSVDGVGTTYAGVSSPHTWGCFYRAEANRCG